MSNKGQERIGLVGAGHALGAIVRDNDDPVFAYLRANPPPDGDLFNGLKLRRVLNLGQNVVSIGIEAARAALDNAGVDATQVDMLLGCASLGEFDAPSALGAVHAALGLTGACRIMALNTQYTEFLDGVKLAHELIRAGSIERALVLASIDWTRHMDYREAVSVAASDAAGAVVVARTSDPSHFALVDWENHSDTKWYGALRMVPRSISLSPTDGDARVYTRPTFKLSEVNGAKAVKAFGLPVPPQVVDRLLRRHGIVSRDITLVTHQTSKLVQDYWVDAIKPGCHVSTLTELADMVSASIPVNFAIRRDHITTDHLVLLGIGMEMRATALLYSR